MTNEQSIGIHFIDLETRERAIFDRVIAFNITHDLKAHTTDDIANSDLIILSESALPQASQYEKKTLLVLSNGSCTSGDMQIQRPLLITKVMNSLGDTIELVNKKLAEDSSPKNEIDETSEDDIEELTEIDSAVAEIAEDKVVTTESTVEQLSNSNDAAISDDEAKSGHHALVIDDSAAIRKQLELELRDAGITSDFAESGEIALEKIAHNHFDLIFLDIIMPGIDGYETCKAMRKTTEYKKTPIIMLSGKTSPLDEVQGVIAGATTYLTKPVKSDKLQETLSRVSKWISNFAEPKKTETA